MESLGIIGALAIVVIVLWWIGVFNSISKLLDMGNAEVDQMKKDQFAANIQRSKKRKVVAADVDAAIKNDAEIQKYMDSLDL